MPGLNSIKRWVLIRTRAPTLHTCVRPSLELVDDDSYASAMNQPLTHLHLLLQPCPSPLGSASRMPAPKVLLSSWHACVLHRTHAHTHSHASAPAVKGKEGRYPILTPACACFPPQDFLTSTAGCQRVGEG